MKEQVKYKVKSRIWITNEDGTTFLGEGRIALLQQIHLHGSISKAAKEMKMSYKKAWELVNSMNRNEKKPLVKQQVGGTGGGGSVLSKEGLAAIEFFNNLNKDNSDF